MVDCILSFFRDKLQYTHYNAFNSFRLYLKFTIEKENNNYISFVDTTPKDINCGEIKPEVRINYKKKCHISTRCS